MLNDLFLNALRSLVKNKFFTLLNVAGLSLGLSVFLFIAQYVKFESGFEELLPGSHAVYRVGLRSYINGDMVTNSAENYLAEGPALLNELPEVTGFARLDNLGYKNNVIITNDSKPEPVAFKHRRFLYADSSFLPLLGYAMVAGNAATAQAEPLSEVISERYSKLYFRNEYPVGKMLRIQDDDYNDELVRITGVFKDLPADTHLKFEILFSYKTLRAARINPVDSFRQA